MPFQLERIGDGSTADTNFKRLSEAVNHPVPQARVTNNAALSPANNTPTALTFNTERFDSGDLHSLSVNTGRLTAPITGLYAVGCMVEFAANATGIRSVQIRLTTVGGVGPTTIAADTRVPLTGAVTICSPVPAVWQFTAGDWVDVAVFQTSGGALNVQSTAAYSPDFWMYRVAGFVNVGV